MRRMFPVVSLVVCTALTLHAQELDDLFSAARSGDVDAVKSALGDGVSVDSVDQYGITALSMAAGNGNLELV